MLLEHLPNCDILFITAGCKFIGVKEVNGILLGELDMSLTPHSRELASKFPQAGRELGRLILNDENFRWLHRIDEIASVPCPYFIWWNRDNKKKIAILNTCYDTPNDDRLALRALNLLQLYAGSHPHIQNKRIIIPHLDVKGIDDLEPNIQVID